MVYSIYTILLLTTHFVLNLIRPKETQAVGYKVRMQKVERPTNKSFYVNFPAVIAEASKIEKGETMEWLIEDRNTFILSRIKPRKSLLKKK
jgi:hypothetical protein